MAWGTTDPNPPTAVVTSLHTGGFPKFDQDGLKYDHDGSECPRHRYDRPWVKYTGISTPSTTWGAITP